MADAGAWGIEPGYRAVDGSWRESPSSTIDAILGAMGADGAPQWRAPRFIEPGDAASLPAGTLRLEAGGEIALDGRPRPAVLPLGYHDLLDRDGAVAERVIVTPGTCRLPDARAWGWAVQVYAARSRLSWGIGDLADIAAVGRWAASQGAGLLLLSPLHAPTPGARQQPSPYYPSSRVFRSPLHLRVELVPGWTSAAAVCAAGHALNDDRLIDRDAVWRLKRAALHAAFERSRHDVAFAAWRQDQGDLLERFATFCALSEHLAVPWAQWPDGLRRAERAAVDRAASEHADAVAFHAWLQWCIDAQLGRAGAEIALVNDLAVGFDPCGADAWLWQDVVASSMRVGAPPDEFNQAGQDWGLPPFDPWRLAASGFEPFIATVRSALRHAGGLRVDHVMGLFRLFWIPEGGSPADGAYVRYPAKELLDLLALESHRAGAYVVGEDLGTVEDWVRAELGRRNVLSYRLLWFEPHPPAQYPEAALAAVTTHDLPTVAGLWSGADLEAQREIGVEANEDSTRAMRDRVAGWAGLGEGASAEEAVAAVHDLVATTASTIVTATLDDAVGVTERPNHPGTTDEWPNWRLALPLPLEELFEHPLAARVAEALSRHR